MPDYFPAAVSIVLGEEGVLSDDVQDPGGETYFGIARASHRAIPWPPTRDQAIAIYRKEFWDANLCGTMPWAWALAIFDCAVNQGSSAVRWAQAALKVSIDGVPGPTTLAAMTDRYAADALRAFLVTRIINYESDHDYPAFGQGWLKRVIRIAQAGAVTPP